MYVRSGARLVSGSGFGIDGRSKGATPEEAMALLQMDADGNGTVSFAELVRYRQRQLELNQWSS